MRRLLRGRKKSKKITWVASRNKWHRVDPTDGRFTACGVKIGTYWGFPWQTETGNPPKLDEAVTKEICMLPECSGAK